MATDTVRVFNSTMVSMFRTMMKNSRSESDIANIERLINRINLYKDTMGDDAILKSSLPFFIEYKDQILQRDEQFLSKYKINGDFSDIFNCIQKNYLMANKDIRDSYYDAIKILFNKSISYHL